MKRILLSLALLGLSAFGAEAATCGNSSVQLKDNNNVTNQMTIKDDGTGNGNCESLIDVNANSQLHTDITGPTTVFAATPTASVTRPANTTTYTANTGWCNLTAACATTFSFTASCRANSGAVLIPEIDIWSSANPALKLQGVLYLFSAAIGTIINDDATFTIAAADFANLTGNQQGFPFTLGNSQAAGAANSGVSLTGTTYHAQCVSGTTTINGMVEVVNAYVPASAEVLHVTLHTVGLN